NYSQFSRIVTRINFKDGAVFSDPADAGAPFGDLPWFDRGIVGLAVKGSKVQEAAIPAGTPDDNVSTFAMTAQVAKDWSLNGDVQLEVKGAEEIQFRDELLSETPEKANQYLTDFFGYGRADAEVSQIMHPEFRDSSQPFVLKAHFKDKVTNEA